jgi:hypothetical protein
MTDHAVTPLYPRGAAPYSDCDALNDIHTIVTAPSRGRTALDTLDDVADVLTRTGRPPVPVRDIETSATETAHGWPVACTQAGDTAVYVRQDPAGPGLRVEITTKTDAEAAALTVTLDGATIHPRGPADPQPA